jgi:hypothetical protein
MVVNTQRVPANPYYALLPANPEGSQPAPRPDQKTARPNSSSLCCQVHCNSGSCNKICALGNVHQCFITTESKSLRRVDAIMSLKQVDDNHTPTPWSLGLWPRVANLSPSYHDHYVTIIIGKFYFSRSLRKEGSCQPFNHKVSSFISLIFFNVWLYIHDLMVLKSSFLC